MLKGLVWPRRTRLQLTTSKPSTSAAEEQQRPKRSDRYSSKELASKQRLAELVEAHKAGQLKTPGQQSARR